MSLKNKLFSIAASGIAVAAFAGFAAAQQDSTSTAPQTDANTQQTRKHDGFRGRGGKDGFGKGMRHGGMMGEFRDLNLTDAQKQQIHSIMEANRPDQNSFGEMKTLMDAKRSGTLTAEQEERFNTLRQEKRAKGKQTHEQMMAVLTDEQRTQFAQKHQEMKEKRKEMRQRREPNTQTPANPQDN